MARTNTSKTTSEKGRSDRHAKKVKRVEPESEEEEEEEREEQEEQEDDGYSSPSVLETGDADAADIGSDLDGEDENDDESSSDDEATDATALQSRMSFGTLVKVQDSLGDNGEGGKRKRKRGVDDEEVDGKLQALRERLRELKGKKARTEESTTAKTTTAKGMKPAERPMFSADSSDEASNEDEEVEEEEEGGENAPAKKKGRSSKHAPTEISSKRAVTRRRDAVVLKKDTTRDPRFDPLSGEIDHHVLAKKYAFLNDYRTAELATLKKSIKNKKLPEEEREALKRQVVSMESKMAFEKGKEREARVVREHRREERKRVLEGKGVWHVKRAVVREEALKERFEGMKGRQRDKVIERRRKKVTAKERKGMPEERRA
ncbi:hypothetical protein EG327_010381 [Venturia inaequalis]|uniref:rRNA biogenesis protein RRP36 n=1 Tax=Venturia inaequalis TaxID=5025 RepID=A0A8H3UK00_VENIN|nr:hypothetical protein EG327_010381 [Venturia inaequalis]